MITPRMLANANKVAFIVAHNKGITMPDLIAALQMPAININTSLWAAEELKFIKKPDPKTQIVELDTPPETYQLGDMVEELEELVLYAFEVLGREEKDLDEVYVHNWLAGYPERDRDILLQHLVDLKQLATYVLIDPDDTESEYTFYTMYDNRENEWGRKNFKKEPMRKGEEVDSE